MSNTMLGITCGIYTRLRHTGSGKLPYAWWRHQMETFSALLTLCAGNSPVTGEFTAQRPVTRSFDVFFDLRLNRRLSKQPWVWWFEMPLCSLWRHCNDMLWSVKLAADHEWFWLQLPGMISFIVSLDAILNLCPLVLCYFSLVKNYLILGKLEFALGYVMPISV